MAELINSNVFDVNKKFVDFAGLDYFWEKAKGYIDGVDTSIAGRVTTNEGAISVMQGQLAALGTGAGSVQSQIQNAIDALKLAETYDSKGAAATAEQNAKAYADGLNTKMDNRVKVLEAIDHEKLASDASAAAVATVLDGAPEKFDTLKEIAQWISDNESAAEAADLVTRVKAIEDLSIATTYETKSDAEDKLAAAKSYTDGKVDGKFDTVGSAATAEQNAKDYADSLAGNYDSKGSAAQALTDAKTYTDELFTSIKFATNSDIDGLFV